MTRDDCSKRRGRKGSAVLDKDPKPKGWSVKNPFGTKCQKTPALA